MIARARKAIVAGLGAGIGAATTVLANAGWHLDSGTIAAALGAFLTAAIVAGLATYNIRNADPKPVAPYNPR